MTAAIADAATLPAAAGRRRTIAALGVTQILAWGSTYYLLAVLAAPIVADTGWSEATVIGGVSLGLFASGLVAIGVGRGIERFGGRPVLAASSVLIAAGLVLLALAPSAAAYLAAWLVLGAGMAAGLYDAAFSTLGRLYGRDARSAITALTLWGGFASTVCWPLSAALVESVGWRGACLVYAGLQLVVALPLHLLAVPAAQPRISTPEPASAGDTISIPAPRLAFPLLAIILTTGGAIAALISVHLIGILQASGLSLGTSVGLGALIGPAQVGSRIVERVAGGRYHPIWTLAAAGLLIAAGLFLLGLGAPVVAGALIAYGAGNGIWSIAHGAVPLAMFGPSGYAVLMGRLAMPILIAQAAAPSLGALLLTTLAAPTVLHILALVATANLAAIVALWAVAQARTLTA